MTTSTEHHVVPQVYLRQFANAKKELTVIRKPGGALSVPPFHAKVQRVAKESHFYTITRPNKEIDLRLEQALSRFESSYPKVIKALRSSKAQDPDCRRDIIFFTALQFARGFTQRFAWDTWFRLGAFGDANAQIGEMPGATHEEVNARLLQLEALSGRAPAGKEERRNWAIAALQATFPEMLSIFSSMYLCILESCAQDFFTSDQPVSIFDPTFPDEGQREYPYFRLPVEVTYPLSKRFTAFLSWMPLPHSADADSRVVRAVNGRVGHASFKEVYVDATYFSQHSRRVYSELKARDEEAKKPLVWQYSSKVHGGFRAPWTYFDIRGLDMGPDVKKVNESQIPRWWAAGLKP